jgi:hypothetical protein
MSENLSESPLPFRKRVLKWMLRTLTRVLFRVSVRGD